MAPRVERSTAQGTGWSTGLDESSNRDREGAGPLSSEVNRRRVVFFDSVEGHLDLAPLGVESEGDVTNHEVGFVFGFEGEVVGQMTRPTEVVEHRPDPLGDGRQLLFFDFEDEESTTLANLEEKEPVAHDSSSSDHDAVGSFERYFHEGTNSFRAEVELTVKTSGTAPPRWRALTEQVETTVR